MQQLLTAQTGTLIKYKIHKRVQKYCKIAVRKCKFIFIFDLFRVIHLIISTIQPSHQAIFLHLHILCGL